MRSAPDVSSPRSPVAAACAACRGALVGTGAISCVTNLLMLTGPLFMLQIYDRVLTSGSVPTLVIWGAGDQIIPASHAEGLPDGVSCTVMDGQGHMVQMEAATEVNRLIDEHVG